ncbi:hypothetical protein DB347_19890 [Opitutaceae bacterium EW11]|nr:hypothetical protein DB347_19890 [Opitutaceae bacterium EW11]
MGEHGGTKKARELVRRFKEELTVYRRVLTDPRTPRLAKWLLGLAIAYLLTPVDIVPDFIPILGQLDDALLVPLLVYLALRLIPKEIVAEHRRSVQAGGHSSSKTTKSG